MRYHAQITLSYQHLIEILMRCGCRLSGATDHKAQGYCENLMNIGVLRQSFTILEAGCYTRSPVPERQTVSECTSQGLLNGLSC
jgi:hypothetical protein